MATTIKEDAINKNFLLGDNDEYGFPIVVENNKTSTITTNNQKAKGIMLNMVVL